MTKKKRRWPLLYLSDCHVLHYATVAIVENMTNKTRHLSSSWGTTDTSADERALPRRGAAADRRRGLPRGARGPGGGHAGGAAERLLPTRRRLAGEVGGVVRIPTVGIIIVQASRGRNY